jgi:hypothetical protein
MNPRTCFRYWAEVVTISATLLTFGVAVAIWIAL